MLLSKFLKDYKKYNINQYPTGYVYKLTDSLTNTVYIGSTKQDPVYRFRKGWKRCSCKHFKNPTVEILSVLNLNEFPDNGLRSIEQYWMDKHSELCVNQIRSFTTKEQRLEQLRKSSRKYKTNPNNKQKIKESKKQYYLKNRTKILKKQKQKYAAKKCK